MTKALDTSGGVDDSNGDDCGFVVMDFFEDDELDKPDKFGGVCTANLARMPLSPDLFADDDGESAEAEAEAVAGVAVAVVAVAAVAALAELLVLSKLVRSCCVSSPVLLAADLDFESDLCESVDDIVLLLVKSKI